MTAAGKQAQCLLKYFGHDPGTVDGIFGSKSRAAAKKAQEVVDSKCRAGLVVDGLIGPKSWPYLRFEACSRRDLKDHRARLWNRPLGGSRALPVLE